MARPYKASNGRIMMRQSTGQFRQTTMTDIGLGCPVCPECHSFNPYDLYRYENGFAIKNQPPTNCHRCGTSLA